MKEEQELIRFLGHIGKTYDLSNEDYFNLEAWIQTIEALGLGENEVEKSDILKSDILLDIQFNSINNSGESL